MKLAILASLMRFVRYCAWIFAGLYILLGLLVLSPHTYLPKYLQLEGGLALSLLYFLSAALFAFAPYIQLRYERILEGLGILYVFLSALGFIVVPSDGYLLGIFYVNHISHWIHLALGTSSFIVAWAAYEAMIRRHQRGYRREG